MVVAIQVEHYIKQAAAKSTAEASVTSETEAQTNDEKDLGELKSKVATIDQDIADAIEKTFSQPNAATVSGAIEESSAG